MRLTAGLDAVRDAGKTTEPPDQPGLVDATIFDILGNERRRACLHCLAEHEGALSVSALGKQVARAVADAEADSDELYDSVYISLCQTHLPKLDAVGLVEYEQNRKRVRQGPRFDAIRDQFEAARTTEKQSSDGIRAEIIVPILTVAIGAAAILSPPAARTVLLFGLVAIHVLVLIFASTSPFTISH
ncbi:DUF7344 domain-containing protein [Haloarcula japonica]|uniref:DUF7344 domain-containing protein n=1 Tax=Haloarcula japonica (strain ATCC 49778 / DSM 6131 / JCM 7785 / NBRC 101032 / NCIMB 13157 / TR-1) TaxID=1227453 RepID=M0LL76_HALJT|nr:hypothetical protein [Haloarcula japonica]EMA32765.1 hypothetical protein C444_06071 [Haloarcula japonica DSM 6131]